MKVGAGSFHRLKFPYGSSVTTLVMAMLESGLLVWGAVCVKSIFFVHTCKCNE